MPSRSNAPPERDEFVRRLVDWHEPEEIAAAIYQHDQEWSSSLLRALRQVSDALAKPCLPSPETEDDDGCPF